MSFRNWNELRLNTFTSINWRASLVPAAAVIPAPIAYIKAVAIKKLVVGLKTRICWFIFTDNIGNTVYIVVNF